MLRIIQNCSSASAQSYYTQGDYYSEGQERAGFWGGKGAKRLGLYGEIRQKDFQALCENRDPNTGERLTPRNKADRTVGYDINFHVPKGVSVVYMLNRDERILDAFRESVRETMQELEADTKTRVRKRGYDDERVTGNLAWAEFVHLTARPVDGVPDPHLHAHCFVFNQTFDSREDRWKAAQFRDIKRDAPYFEAAFYSRLAKRLKDLGYPIARQGKKWDLASVSKSLSQKFSRRTAQIERHAEAERAEQERNLTAKEKDKLGAKTREKKDKELSMTELRTLWRERLSDDERDSLQRASTKEHAVEFPAVTPERAVEHAVMHCFERNSVIAKRQLLAEAMLYGIGDLTPEATDRQVDASGILIGSWEGREMATTREVLAEEQKMLAFAREGRGQCQPLASDWNLDRQWLNPQQRLAVSHVATSHDRVMVIKGMAGTGKTTLMQEAVGAIELGGHQVFTFAPSANASRDVLRSEGFPNATTVAELLQNQQLQESAAGQVLWIDEAGLLGTRELAHVFDIAQRIDARVVLSGDWRQHGSVTRGAAMRLLEHEGGIKPAIVSEIQRQKGIYREAVALLAKGDSDAGFERLDELGWIRELDDEHRPQAIAREYAESLEGDGEAPLVVSPTHREGEEITAAIREELKRRKLLGDKEEKIQKLTSRNLTEAERADPAMYEAGDVVVFQQNAPGHRKGERIVVCEAPTEELTRHAKRFQVYKQSELPIATGDMVRFTANSQTKDGKHRLNNGAMYRIERFDESGDLRLSNGWIVSKNHGFLTSGYTVTSHASQGKTVGKVLIAESSRSLVAASQEQFYVSVSRGKHQAIVFTDDKVALREAVAKSTPRLAATELVQGSKPSRQVIRQQVARVQQLVARRSNSMRLPEREAYAHRR